MNNSALQTVQQFLLAVQSVNLETIGALLHPQVQWSVPGNNRFSGVKKNAAEVFQMVGGMFEATDNTFALAEIIAVAEHGNKVAAVLRFHAEKNGDILDTTNVDVYTVSGGQITAVEAFATDVELEDDFWGK
jgi:ketosteroid isomerase-like protein